MPYLNRYSVVGFCTGVITAFGFLVCIGWAMSQAARRSSLPLPPVPIGQSFYDGPTSQTVLRDVATGSEFRLQALKGRPAFVNYWATWCAPCVAEMPSIQKLYDAARAANVSFAIISTESEDTVREFVRKHHFTFPVYVTRSGVSDRFGVPRTLILDVNGNVLVDHTGAANWGDPKSVSFVRRIDSGVLPCGKR